jgi:hypothetical protein
VNAAVGAEDAVVSGFEMRVSDAEREAVAAELREHFASGRLTQDELNERLDQTFAARTRGDLNAVLTDLPGSPSWPSARSGWADGAVPAGTPFAGSGSRRAGAGSRRAGAGYRRSCGAGNGWQHGAGRTAGTLVSSFVMLAALLTLGIVGAFGLGGGHPLAVVLLIAAFALLRRLVFGIFRRRRGGMRGPRRRC